MSQIKDFRPGVLSNTQLKCLIKNGIISGFPNDEDIDHSAFDLHLGDYLWVMQGGIKGRRDKPYCEELIHCERKTLSDGCTLDPQNTYVIEIQEKINYANYQNLFGFATGRSSIGRLDVLTRLIADYSEFYDELPCPDIIEYHKVPIINLYVEVTPISMGIRVKRGNSLNQLRLFRGAPKFSLLEEDVLRYYGDILIGSDTDSISYLSVDLTPAKIADSESASAFIAK